MANTIKIKRGTGSDPSASDMVLGEPVLRTDTAELFFKKDDGSVAKVSGGGGGPDFKYLALRNAANNGAASYPNADFTLVTSGTTTAITPTAANTLLVSVNGVIQKPNTGTSTPSSGFALNGSTIKFGANISAAPDFILYQESGGIGEPSDNTVSEAKLKVSNSPVNGYFLSAQSGNTGGLTWAAPIATSCTGNSATATALATARTINGTSFDGTANITVTAAAGTLTGNTLNSSVTASSLTSLGDLSGLTVTGNMTVDTSTLFVNASTNRVGVGTTSPSQLLHVAGTLECNNIKFLTANKFETSANILEGKGVNGARLRSALSGATTPSFSNSDDTDTGLFLPGSDVLGLTTGGTERMRIDSSGHILGCGMSSLTANTNVSGFNFSFQSDHGRLNLHAKGTAATPTLVEAFYHSANHVGGIRLTSSSTAYGTTSDYRLKENAIPISDGITRLKTLKPYRFNFKIEPDKKVDGFFAHEVTAVPEAITGTKDEIFTEDDDTRGAKAGDPKYQEIDQSKLVPLLVAALQEAIGRIEALEAK